MRALRQLLRLGCLVLTLTAAGVVLSALWFDHSSPPAAGDVIVVLGGDMTRDGRLAPETRHRVRAGVALYQAGLAPRIHFTGGPSSAGRPAGDQMMRLALRLGVPVEAVSAENQSRSTLQNALMSRQVLGPLAGGRVILVSDGFHLGRAWASFRWAGYPHLAVFAASAFGHQPAAQQAFRVAREVLAWWFNIARVGIWEILAAVSGPDPARIDLLR